MTAALAVAGQLDDLAAVGALEHVARERLVGRAERDLAAVEAQHAVPAPRLLDVVRGDRAARAPRAASASSSASSRSALGASRPVNGSSSSMSGASCTSARATSTRWRWPPDSSPNVSPARSRQPDALERRAARAARSRAARPPPPRQRANAPISATSSALTGKSSRERSVCGTVAAAPATSSAPASGGSSPSSTRNSVVLPPPLGPRTATRSPGARRELTSRSTGGAVARRQPDARGRAARSARPAIGHPLAGRR